MAEAIVRVPTLLAFFETQAPLIASVEEEWVSGESDWARKERGARTAIGIGQQNGDERVSAPRILDNAGPEA